MRRLASACSVALREVVLFRDGRWRERGLSFSDCWYHQWTYCSIYLDMSDLMLKCAMMFAAVCVSASVACVAVYIMGSYRIFIASHLAHTELRTRITRFWSTHSLLSNSIRNGKTYCRTPKTNKNNHQDGGKSSYWAVLYSIFNVYTVNIDRNSVNPLFYCY